MDARGVKTLFNYSGDPFNRLQSVRYITSGVPAGLIGNIPAAPDVSYAYLTGTGDKTRLQSVTMTNGMGNETFSYDSEGRLSQASQTFTGRTGHPLVTDYLWDSMDRSQELNYPAQYGQSGNPRKKAEPTYDIASRVDTLKYDGVNYASGFTYNAASQVESLSVGSLMTESYGFDPKDRVDAQPVGQARWHDASDLKYNYTANHNANNDGAKTGQLTGVTDVKNTNRSRAFFYDRLGRLNEVWGGTNAPTDPTWWHYYNYDRYGNRTSASKDGPAKNTIPLARHRQRQQRPLHVQLPGREPAEQNAEQLDDRRISSTTRWAIRHGMGCGRCGGGAKTNSPAFHLQIQWRLPPIIIKPISSCSTFCGSTSPTMRP